MREDVEQYAPMVLKELELERDTLLEILPRTCMNMQELAAVADTCRCSEVCVVCEESEAHQSLRSKQRVIPFMLRLSIATRLRDKFDRKRPRETHEIRSGLRLMSICCRRRGL